MKVIKLEYDYDHVDKSFFILYGDGRVITYYSVLELWEYKDNVDNVWNEYWSFITITDNIKIYNTAYRAILISKQTMTNVAEFLKNSNFKTLKEFPSKL